MNTTRALITEALTRPALEGKTITTATVVDHICGARPHLSRYRAGIYVADVAKTLITEGRLERVRAGVYKATYAMRQEVILGRRESEAKEVLSAFYDAGPSGLTLAELCAKTGFLPYRANLAFRVLVTQGLLVRGGLMGTYLHKEHSGNLAEGTSKGVLDQVLEVFREAEGAIRVHEVALALGGPEYDGKTWVKATHYVAILVQAGSITRITRGYYALAGRRVLSVVKPLGRNTAYKTGEFPAKLLSYLAQAPRPVTPSEMTFALHDGHHKNEAVCRVAINQELTALRKKGLVVLVSKGHYALPGKFPDEQQGLPLAA
jgi:predicted transcriptional regulator of viral defense system